MYYESYFELTEPPFSISPDPRYLYLTQNHREALAHLLYGVSSNGGFVLLTGEIGAGKTTVCQCLLEQLPESSDVAYILNPKLETWEFFAAICDELGIAYPQADTSLKAYIDRIRDYLLNAHSRGRNTVLMIDEAQNLSTELMEHLRLLTNLETTEKKLLQIMLVGQPELREKIALPEMQQMAQRITARFHLGPLSKKEVAAYVHHRLKVAGANRELFSRESLKLLWKATQGVPRLINIICDRALLGAFVTHRAKVDAIILGQAAQEVLGRSLPVADSRRWRLAAGACALLLVAGAFAATYYYRHSLQVPVLSGFVSGGEVIPPEGAMNPVGAMDRVDPEATESTLSTKSTPSPAPATTPHLAFPTGTENLEFQAYQALFQHWQLPYNTGGDSTGAPCDFAYTLSMGCLGGQGNLTFLRKLNRPALLTLYDSAGRAMPAALLGIEGDIATLSLGGQRQQVPVSELEQHWYGNYILLWQFPPGYRYPVRTGARGPAVAWILQQLGEAIAATENPTYTGEQEQNVKAFQAANGLEADGVVGPLTVIALQNRGGAPGPRLVKE